MSKLWESMKDNLGKCYELSWQYISKEGYKQNKRNLTLIHGYITNFNNGICIDHAWIEYDDKVYDTVMEKEFPKRVYYAMYKAEIGKSYTYKESMDQAIRTETYGPWHKIPYGKVKWWKEEKMRKVENVIEIKSEIQINENIILEVGDKIQLVQEAKEPEFLDDLVSSGKRLTDYWSQQILVTSGSLLVDIYMKAMSSFYKELKIGEEVRNDYYNDDDDSEEYFTVWGQESYLGYIPSTETFVSGFDYNNEGESCSAFVFFTINNDSVKIDYSEVHDGSFMYGRNNSGLDYLRNNFKGIQDIRLD